MLLGDRKPENQTFTKSEIQTYTRKANRNLAAGLVVILGGVFLQLGVGTPLCIAIHSEPIKSELCEDNLIQTGKVATIIGVGLVLAGGAAKRSLENMNGDDSDNVLRIR